MIQQFDHESVQEALLEMIKFMGLSIEERQKLAKTIMSDENVGRMLSISGVTHCPHFIQGFILAFILIKIQEEKNTTAELTKLWKIQK